MINHVMLDLETWGTGPFSMIISIGACVFDPYASMPEEIIRDRFEVAIDPTSYQARIDPATIMWWIDPEREPARAEWLKMPKVELAAALDGFSNWMHAHSTSSECCTDLRIWGNGAGFDNVLLRQAYDMMKRDAPWSFRHDRCFRTLRSMLTDENLQYLGTQHTALADAVNQAIRANQIVRKLGIQLT